MLELQSKAPLFSLKNEKGYVVSLSDFLGKKVVLYFYPKDNTPGCTRQACAFRDLYDEFAKLGVEVIGISKDTIKSHQKFIDDFNLPFILLSDTEKKTLNDYQVLYEKKMYGKPVLSVRRTTYIIDEKGYIEKVFANADPDKNAQEILDYLKGQ